MRGSIGGHRRAFIGRQYTGILIGDFDAELRRAQTRQRLDLAAQGVAVVRLLLQDRLIRSECSEIVFAQHRNLRKGFEHVDATRLREAQAFDH